MGKDHDDGSYEGDHSDIVRRSGSEKSRKKHSRRDLEKINNDSQRDRKESLKRSRESDSSDASSRNGRRQKDRCRRRKRKHSSKDRRKSKSKTSRPSSSEDSSSDDSSLGDEQSKRKLVVNERLQAKLSARGETLEERKARRAEKRAALIKSKLGYTAEDNPFNDPNLTETFTWTKRDAMKGIDKSAGLTSMHTLGEIEKVRQRRKDREDHHAEMERIRAEESRMKELENYDDWARKEEEFHLQQQRQRSAIRLVEGREKPVDVLAKNIMMFGLSESESKNRSAVKYQERYNAMDAIESLDVELEEPPTLLKMLKLNELEELIVDIDIFRSLERETSVSGPGLESTSTILRYWDNLWTVAADEIKLLKSGGDKGGHAKMVSDVNAIFDGQDSTALLKMKSDIDVKLRAHASNVHGEDEEFDRNYWAFVQEQLVVHLAKLELSELHSKMLVRQLERLERKKAELAMNPTMESETATFDRAAEEDRNPALPENVSMDFGDLEEELGLSGEVELQSVNYSWQDRYRPRKPRYFNRVKTGYDWNKYNQTHYDKDNPPPKIVQGYKFNIFYPDLIDPTKTPQFFLEPADVDEFCIIRFRAGPPYEDLAFKIVNREWNRSRKRGYKSTFERGVLSLYFNFTTHWYRK
jgi:Cactus-binding C-terminus of cactin protein/Conserved mid region of cactin